MSFSAEAGKRITSGVLSLRPDHPAGLPTREKKPLATGIAAVPIQGPFA
jgi:hypothetical protein